MGVPVCRHCELCLEIFSPVRSPVLCPVSLPTDCRASVKDESAGCVECSNVRTLPPFIICLWYAHNPVRPNTSHAPGIFYKLYASTLPPFSLVMPLSLGNCAVVLSVARVKSGGFSPTISNYIFTSPRSKLLPLTFRPLGRGQGDAIEKQEKRILLS